MYLVARIDTLRRVADLEIGSQRHSRFLFKDRSADILCHPRIDRRLIDDDCAFFICDPTMREADSTGERSGVLS